MNEWANGNITGMKEVTSMVRNKMYTIPELAEYIGVRRATLYDYIKQGKLKAVKFGRLWRVSEEERDRFLSTGVSEKRRDRKQA